QHICCPLARITRPLRKRKIASEIMFVREVIDPAERAKNQVKQRGHAISARDSSTSLGMTRRAMHALLFKQQFAGAAGRFDDRLDQRDTEFPFFELQDAVDCAASWGSDCVL